MDTLEFWNAYHTDVKRFILSKVKDESITNDLVQETFLKVHLKKEQLKEPEKAKSWLLTMARNIVFDYFKKNQLRYIENKDQVLEQTNTTPSHTEKDCLPGLIKNLPELYRVPLFLSDIQGVKQAVIAKQLNRPLATIKSQIQRGRKLIVKGYMDCCNYTLDAKGKLVGEVKDSYHCKICNIQNT